MANIFTSASDPCKTMSDFISWRPLRESGRLFEVNCKQELLSLQSSRTNYVLSGRQLQTQCLERTLAFYQNDCINFSTRGIVLSVTRIYRLIRIGQSQIVAKTTHYQRALMSNRQRIEAEQAEWQKLSSLARAKKTEWNYSSHRLFPKKTTSYDRL